MMLNDGFSSKPSSWWHRRVIEASPFSATNRSIGRWSWYDHEIQSTSMNPNTKPTLMYSCWEHVELLRENSQRGLDHPNVVKLYEVFEDEELRFTIRFGLQYWHVLIDPPLGEVADADFRKIGIDERFNEISCWCCFFNSYGPFEDFEDGNGKFS